MNIENLDVTVLRHSVSEATGLEYGVYSLKIGDIRLVVMQKGEDYITFYRLDAENNKLIDDTVKDFMNHYRAVCHKTHIKEEFTHDAQ